MRERRFVYAIYAPDAHTIKIGFSGWPEERMKLFQEGHSVPLQMLAKISGTWETEQRIHERLQAHRLGGEWFRECPEVMEVVEEMIARAAGRERSIHRHRLCATQVVAIRTEVFGDAA